MAFETQAAFSIEHPGIPDELEIRAGLDTGSILLLNSGRVCMIAGLRPALHHRLLAARRNENRRESGIMTDPVPAASLAPACDGLIELRDALRRFATERDWEQFHTPKNLASALSVEAAELLEPFQWLTAEQSAALDEPTFARVRAEMADVLLYLVRLADVLGVDLLAAAREKMAINAQRYPADKARGSSRKYSDY